MLNRDCLGRVSELRVIDIEKGQLKLFAKAIGETDPIYFDEVAAKEAGHPGIPSTLTFGSCLRFLAPAEKPSLEEMGLDYARVLHAEEKLEFMLPIHAGDRLNLVTEIVDMYDKKGGALEFLVRETRVCNEAGDLVQKFFNTIVMENG